MPKLIVLATGATALMAAITGLAPSTAQAGPACPDKVNVINSDAAHIVGTECADRIIAGPHTLTVDALGGDDVVSLPEVAPNLFADMTVDLGAGNDRLTSVRTSFPVFHGGPGDDTIRTLTPEESSLGEHEIYGDAGNDTLLISGAGIAEGGDGDDVIVYSKGETGILTSIIAKGGNGDDLIDTRQANLTPDPNSIEAVRWVSGDAGNDILRTAQSPLTVKETVVGGAGLDTAQINATDPVSSVEKVTKKD